MISSSRAGETSLELPKRGSSPQNINDAGLSLRSKQETRGGTQEGSGTVESHYTSVLTQEWKSDDPVGLGVQPTETAKNNRDATWEARANYISSAAFTGISS